MGWSQVAVGQSRNPTAGLGRLRGHAPQRSWGHETLRSQGSCRETRMPYFLAQQVGDMKTSRMRLPCLQVEVARLGMPGTVDSRMARGSSGVCDGAAGERWRGRERDLLQSRSGSSVAMASSKPTPRTRRPSSRKPQGKGKVLPAVSGKATMAAFSKPRSATRFRKDRVAGSWT